MKCSIIPSTTVEEIVAEMEKVYGVDASPMVDALHREIDLPYVYKFRGERLEFEENDKEEWVTVAKLVNLMNEMLEKEFGESVKFIALF